MRTLFCSLLLTITLLITPNAHAESACDCSREIDRLSDADTDLQRLRDKQQKLNDEIRDIDNEADQVRKQGDKLVDQNKSTLDLINKAKAKGNNLNMADLDESLKDAQKEISDKYKEADNISKRADGKRNESKQLDGKIKQAEKAREAAERDYRACKNRCGAEQVKKDEPIIVIPGTGVVVDTPAMCPPCQDEEAKVDALKKQLEDATKLRELLEQSYNETLDSFEKAKAKRNETSRRTGEAMKKWLQDTAELLELAKASDVGAGKDGIADSPTYKEGMKAFNDLHDQHEDADLEYEEIENYLDDAQERFRQAENKEDMIAEDLAAAIQALEACNKSCGGKTAKRECTPRAFPSNNDHKGVRGDKTFICPEDEEPKEYISTGGSQPTGPSGGTSMSDFLPFSIGVSVSGSRGSRHHDGGHNYGSAPAPAAAPASAPAVAPPPPPRSTPGFHAPHPGPCNH